MMAMTQEKLVSRLFKTVAAYLRGFERELEEFRVSGVVNHGIEPWFGVKIKEAVSELVLDIRPRGPDLILRDGTEIELKASTNCGSTYMAGTSIKDRGWQIMYLHRPKFAGCLFLGDGFRDKSSVEDKIKQITDLANPDVVKFHKHQGPALRDAGGNYWLLGLLLRTDWPRS